TFEWTAAAGADTDTRYELYLVRCSDSQVTVQNNIAGTAYTLPQALNPMGHYYFWIGAYQATDATVPMAWSEQRVFQVYSLAAPTPTGPVGNMTLPDTQPVVFTWTPSDPSLSYQIYVFDNETAIDQAYTSNPGASEYTVPDSFITGGHTYKYWIRALD